MATSPDLIRSGLTKITAAALERMAEVVDEVPPDRTSAALLLAVPLLVPDFYDMSGALAVDWYDELRDEANPASAFRTTILRSPSTGWIEREIRQFQIDIERDLESEMARLNEQAEQMVQKEIASGFRDAVDDNVLLDDEAVGWSRHARPTACKFCKMLAARGAVYSKETARFAAHGKCYCTSRPEFRNGDLGPEASPLQYIASQNSRTPEQKRRLREYLTENFPDAPG